MDNRTAVRAAGAAGIAGLLGYAAWRRGLFFDADAYAVETILFAIGVAAAAGLWRRARAAETGEDFAWMLPLAMAACYGAALLSGPASVRGTADAMLRWTAYAGWFAALTIWRRIPGTRAWGEAAVQACGLFLLLGGWLGWYGVLPFPEIVQRFSDPELSATGVRLAGFLQYPNAYGAALAFFLLRLWQVWADGAEGGPQSRKAARGDRKRTAAASLLSIPYGGALLLTESRGSLAALLAGFVLAMALAGGRQARVRLAAAAGWTAIGAWAAARGAVMGMEGAVWAGGWLTAGALAAGGAAMYGIRLGLEKLGQPGGIAVRFPFGFTRLWPVLGLFLVAGIYFRQSGPAAWGRLFSGHYQTVSARLLLYRDGWNMFLDAPWLGRGGDSWRALLGLYQSRPYVGSEVHSGYLDVLLETGLLGFAVWAALLGYGLWKMRKVCPAAVAPAAVLLVHAAVDFDLSYGWTWLLLLAWIALFAAGERTVAAAGPPGALRRWGSRGAAALLFGASAWGAWAAWHADAAARAFAAADRAAAVPAAREAALRAALAANPAEWQVRLALAALLPFAGERERVLAAGLRYEPFSAALRLQLGLAEAELGREAQAETRLREALRLDRFNREAQTAAIAGMTRLAEALRFQGRAEEARRALEAAVSFYEEYRSLVQRVNAMEHPANDRRFGMTDSAEYHAAQAYAELGRPDEARRLLKRLAAEGTSDWSGPAQQLLDSLDRPGK